MIIPAKNSNLSKSILAANNNQNPNKVGATKQPCPIYDVIVILAGTVDPINSDKEKLANSFADKRSKNPPKAGELQGPKQRNEYEGASMDPSKPIEHRRDTDYYWDGNPAFVDALIAFQKSHDHVHVFGDHGWSGDNCVKNRELAGQYLGDWFVGNKRESALPTYLKRKVSFHLFGHSHGGNVLNEFTKHIAKIAWPADWKLKSYIYLSTPFFQKIHKPNPARNHGSAKVCNVFCQYDITQTAIADFSLRQLTRVTDVVVSAPKTLKPPIDRIVSFDMNSLWALARAPRPTAGWTGWLPEVGMKWEMDATKGRNLYTRILAVLKDVKLVFDEIKKMVRALNVEQDTRISEPFMKKDLVEKRKIIGDAARDEIIGELDKVLAGLTPTEAAFKARVASGVFPVKGFIADIKVEAFVMPLLALLEINAASLEGKIPHMLYSAFKEQIEVFDDTLQTCDHIHKIPIQPVDVSSHDKYYQRRDRQFFDFKSRLIRAEQAYFGAPNQRNFTNLLFVLAAQIEDIHQILLKVQSWTTTGEQIFAYYAQVDNSSSFYLRMMDLMRVAREWFMLFNARYSGGIEVDELPRIEGNKYGSVPYLATVSHSVSRFELYPEVDKFLRAQFDSHETKPQR